MNTIIYLMIYVVVTYTFSLKDKSAKDVRNRFLFTSFIYVLLSCLCKTQILIK